MAFNKLAAVLAVLALQAAASPIESQDDKAAPQPYEFEYGVNAPATPHSGGSSQQGHAEARVGDHSIGNYYVQLPEQGAGTKVSYTTDLWGYHPVVSYHSKESSARFVYGDRATAAVSNPQNPGNLPVSIDAAAKVADYDVADTLHTFAAAGNPPLPNKLAQELEKTRVNLAAAQGHGGHIGASAVVAHAPVAPLPVAHHVPVQQLAPVVHHQPLAQYAPSAPAYNIYEQQKLVKPIVVAEFASNNHALAHHAPVTALPSIVSTTPAPFVSYASPSPAPYGSYASPTPAPVLFSSPHPVVHHEGGYFASTVGPQAFSVTPRPLQFVSSTPQPALLTNIGADISHHAHVHEKQVVQYVDRPVPVEVTKFVEKQVQVPVEVTKYVDRPVQVTKFVDRPVEVTKFVDRPVHVTKFVDRPVEVTKFVDRPVHVTKYVDRPVHVTKFVDRPVEVTKFVDRPVQVTKYVDRPVEVIKHVSVEKPVYVPGPTIEKHVPVPVTKVVHVDRPVPHPVQVPVAVPHPVPYAQYVLNVPYNGQFSYGKIRGSDSFRSENYADAAYRLDAWKAEQANAFKGGFSGFRTEALLKPTLQATANYGAGFGYAGGYGGGYSGGFSGSYGGYNGNYRTESADLKGFKVSKTVLTNSDIVPQPGPTKVTLTVEPHVHKTELGRTLCTEGFKPPFVPSRFLGLQNENW